MNSSKNFTKIHPISKIRIVAAGFDIKPSQSAIVAIMLYDARLSQDFAAALLEAGIYVVGFYYPVVPQVKHGYGQLSAAHSRQQLDMAIDAFVDIGRKKKIIK
jgi:glycine C-acetyltransferase